MNSNYMSQQNRTERYVDFDQMEYMPEIASALDIYADEMTTSSPLAEMLDIRCPNEEIKAILNSLYMFLQFWLRQTKESFLSDIFGVFNRDFS